MSGLFVTICAYILIGSVVIVALLSCVVFVMMVYSAFRDGFFGELPSLPRRSPRKDKNA